jgi:hypothetical protein
MVKTTSGQFTRGIRAAPSAASPRLASGAACGGSLGRGEEHRPTLGVLGTDPVMAPCRMVEAATN